MFFFGKDLPLEMKNNNGFILRGLAAADSFQLREDLQGLYSNKLKFIEDDQPDPDSECTGMQVRLERVHPFTQKKRRRFRMPDNPQNDDPDNPDEISSTLDEQGKQYFPQEFKEYFEQNFKNQFFKTTRKRSTELEEAFLE